MFRCLLGVLATLVAVQSDVSGARLNFTQRRMGSDRISRVLIERLPSSRKSPSLWQHYGSLDGLENLFPYGKRNYFDDGILAEENYVFNTLAMPPNSPMPTANGMHLPFPHADIEPYGDLGHHRIPLMETAASGQHAFVIDDWTRQPVASQLNPTWVGKMAVDNSLMDEFMGRLHRGEVDLNNLRPIDPKLFTDNNDLPTHSKISASNSNRVQQNYQHHHVGNNQHHHRPNNKQHHVAHSRDLHPAALRGSASLIMPEIWPASEALRFENLIAHELPFDLFSKHEYGRYPIHEAHSAHSSQMKPLFYHELMRHHAQLPPPMRGQESFLHRPQYAINQSVIPTPPSESTSQSETSSDRSQQGSKDTKEQSGSKKKLASASSVVKKSAPGIFTYKLLAAAEKRVRSTASTVASLITTTTEPTEKSQKEP